ncbi:YqaJ domain-containing protein [Aphis craccivora]|uniref:YqaJ domain-containing protein n=1 Tax=Aphis craccivora TaxID=307492 RepID=A0A6G0YZC4_APHCR|nr:YqaJ domain-containing protein [Aphis craccivora]
MSMIWSPKGFVIDKISKDESFWNTNIEPFVTRFYMDSLLPEIINSRFDRGLPIRPGIPEK